MQQVKATLGLRDLWRELIKGTVMNFRSMGRSFRYGLLKSGSALTGYSYMCQACRDKFMSIEDAFTHFCPHETEFREITLRTEQVFKQRKANGETVSHYIKKGERPSVVDPTADVGLTDAHAAKYFNDMIDANRSMTSEIEKLMEDIESLTQQLKYNQNQLEGFDRAAKENKEIRLTNEEAKIHSKVGGGWPPAGSHLRV